MEHLTQTTGSQCTHPQGQSQSCHIEMTVKRREVCNTEGGDKQRHTQIISLTNKWIDLRRKGSQVKCTIWFEAEEVVLRRLFSYILLTEAESCSILYNIVCIFVWQQIKTYEFLNGIFLLYITSQIQKWKQHEHSNYTGTNFMEKKKSCLGSCLSQKAIHGADFYYTDFSHFNTSDSSFVHCFHLVYIQSITLGLGHYFPLF